MRGYEALNRRVSTVELHGEPHPTAVSNFRSPFLFEGSHVRQVDRQRSIFCVYVNDNIVRSIRIICLFINECLKVRKLITRFPNNSDQDGINETNIALYIMYSNLKNRIYICTSIFFFS